MNSPEPIGGFFELELRRGVLPWPGAVLLGSGRNCFEYILRATGAKRVYLPFYTCDVMLEPLKALGIPHVFYHVTSDFELAEDIVLSEHEYLVYTNYFGLKDAYSRQLGERYGEKLILDASQAWFFDAPPNAHTFYSPRKFFGLPDGGVLISSLRLDDQLPVADSASRLSHLLGRIEQGPEAAYADFQANDRALSDEPLQRMSRLTRRLLESIDFETARGARLDNFAHLHRRLQGSNKLKVTAAGHRGPMYYPYRTDDTGLRKHLIDQKIFIPTYWPNVLEWCRPGDTEYELTHEILPLPIDQRYGRAEMERIVEVLSEHTN